MKDKLGKKVFCIDNKKYRFCFKKCDDAFVKLWEKRNEKEKLNKSTLEAELSYALCNERSTFHTWRFGPSSPTELSIITKMAELLELESVLCLLVPVKVDALDTQVGTIATSQYNDDLKVIRVVLALDLLAILIHILFWDCVTGIADAISTLLNFSLPERFNMICFAFGALAESFMLYKSFSLLVCDKEEMNRDSFYIEIAWFVTICCALYFLVSWAKI